MDKKIPLQPGIYYHIFNRGNNREDLFYEERNYQYFLKLLTRYVCPVADIYAYCLMRNHFHMLIRVKTEEEYKQFFFEGCDSEPGSEIYIPKFNPVQQFSNLFNAYSKPINKACGRTGSLFEECYKRYPVTSDSYFQYLVFYIHHNPQKHGFVEDFRSWYWSSYKALCGEAPSRLKRVEVLAWFGGVQSFCDFHRGLVEEKNIQGLIEGDGE